MRCQGFVRARLASLLCITVHLITYVSLIVREMVEKYEAGMLYIQASTIVYAFNVVFGLLALASFGWPKATLVLPLTCFMVLNLVVSTCAVWAEGEDNSSWGSVVLLYFHFFCLSVLVKDFKRLFDGRLEEQSHLPFFHENNVAVREEEWPPVTSNVGGDENKLGLFEVDEEVLKNPCKTSVETEKAVGDKLCLEVPD